jgi:hypothetical protein
VEFDKKRAGQQRERDKMMPAAAGAAFEVVEGDLVRQLLGGVLDPPAILNHPREVPPRGGLGEIGKEKLRQRRCAGWPFGDQPAGGLRFGSGDMRHTSGCRQELAHFEPEVPKRAKPGWLHPREISPSRIWAIRASLRRSRLPTDWTELVQVRDHRSIFQTSPEELPVIDIRVF